MRHCKKCNTDKSLDQFSPDKRKKEGRAYTCRECNNTRNKSIRQTKGFNFRKNRWLETEYGITLNEYNKMFLDQKGNCKICNKHQSEFKRALNVDHCHNTGKIRGLLCDKCNRALGWFDDNIESLERAIKYLKPMPSPPKNADPATQASIEAMSEG